ncbi:hypothetical protein [Flavobacterium psychrophilum]|uniref:hypothetical protein n=1 Tax=Flavobacterium psychrophilum TaxID=96345 RepID=UPI00061879AB|nr:hypothetical protein [Flavobacterium psychrophilum]EKT3957112.1 hypothetical protein [Flavobacterium psychrophilum]EKT4509811.1 hypothetical protein [Flavobacterium psychrophilum]MCB6089560.1 hypothetical protein [Flavobacterium psychrophilum]MCB6232124.1 hypothetical protein [Flavobacterium psychrophilum]MEB3380644.1 hypothetical protein [Flavobacterium psychrophilum]
MKISDIHSFLEKKNPLNEFLDKYKNEFENYNKLMNKKGSSVPIYIEEDFNFNFSKKYLLFISNLFLSELLTEAQINYIVDCILLSDNININNENVLELLETYTDSEVNGNLTFKYVQDVVLKLT